MKLSDIIKHTQKTLPEYTSYFSNGVMVSSLTSIDKECTVITKYNHNLNVGDLFTLEGAKIENEIVSLTQSKGLGTLVTKHPHDVTKNTPIREGDSTHIEIFGANESEYNGKFLIMNIPNSNMIEFDITENAPIEATGNPTIKEDTYANYNGRHTVTEVVDDRTFKYVLDYIPDTNKATGDIIIKNGIRISGDYSVQNAISAYEQYGRDQLWGFLVLDGASVSKSKTNGTDAISNFEKGMASSLDLIQDLSFFVFIPTSEEYCWVDFVDIAQELRYPVLKTLHNVHVSSGAYDDDTYFSFVGDNPVDTDGTAYAIYQYKFQATVNILNEDGVDPDYSARIKRFILHDKNNNENLKDTKEYISEGDLPNESFN